MDKKLKGISIKNILLLMFFLINIYFSYRYIFQYSSESTSPTYSETPWTFQVGKYLILAVGILACFLLSVVFNKGFKSDLLNFSLFCFILILVLFGILNSQIETTIRIIIMIISAAFILVLEDIDGFIKGFITINKVLLVYHIIYSFVQLFMYYRYGRLSALSYIDMQRYGGGYDDPNSFAVYLILPICYILLKGINGNFYPKNILLLVICIGLEFLTFSFTGYAILITALVIILIAKGQDIFRFNRKVKVTVLALIIGLMGIAIIFSNFSSIIELFTQKSGSIMEHLNNYLLDFNFENVKGFFFGYSGGFSENFWNLILCNYGIFALILFIFIASYITIISYRTYKYYRDEISLICFIFVFCIELFSINLPYFYIIPVNMIYWYLAFISINRYYKTNESDIIGSKMVLPLKVGMEL